MHTMFLLLCLIKYSCVSVAFVSSLAVYQCLTSTDGPEPEKIIANRNKAKQTNEAAVSYFCLVPFQKSGYHF